MRPGATPSFPGDAGRGHRQTRAPFPARKSAADVASGRRLIGPLLKTDTCGDSLVLFCQFLPRLIFFIYLLLDLVLTSAFIFLSTAFDFLFNVEAVHDFQLY